MVFQADLGQSPYCHLNVEHDLKKGTKTYQVKSKGVDGFRFGYSLTAPNVVNAVALEGVVIGCVYEKK